MTVIQFMVSLVAAIIIHVGLSYCKPYNKLLDILTEGVLQLPRILANVILFLYSPRGVLDLILFIIKKGGKLDFHIEVHSRPNNIRQGRSDTAAGWYNTSSKEIFIVKMTKHTLLHELGHFFIDISGCTPKLLLVEEIACDIFANIIEENPWYETLLLRGGVQGYIRGWGPEYFGNPTKDDIRNVYKEVLKYKVLAEVLKQHLTGKYCGRSEIEIPEI